MEIEAKTGERIAGALEKIAKLLSWARRAERKREKELHAMANWQGARLTIDAAASKCIYCSAIDYGLRRGSVYFGCMACLRSFMASVDDIKRGDIPT